jgi:hypothetical protein
MVERELYTHFAHERTLRSCLILGILTPVCCCGGILWECRGLNVTVADGCTVTDLKVDGKPTPIRESLDGRKWDLPQGRPVTVEAIINGKHYRRQGVVEEGELYPVIRCNPPRIQVEGLDER